MNKDDFKQTLIQQYSEFIEEIIVESKSVYRSQIDFSELDDKVSGLIKSARVDGLDEATVWGIIEHKVPDYYQYVMRATSKIAA